MRLFCKALVQKIIRISSWVGFGVFLVPLSLNGASTPLRRSWWVLWHVCFVTLLSLSTSVVLKGVFWGSILGCFGGKNGLTDIPPLNSCILVVFSALFCMYDAICPISMSKSVEIGVFCAISVEIEHRHFWSCFRYFVSMYDAICPISMSKSVEIGGFCAKTPVTALNDRKCDQNVVYAVLSRFLSQNPDFDT